MFSVVLMVVVVVVVVVVVMMDLVFSDLICVCWGWLRVLFV